MLSFVCVRSLLLSLLDVFGSDYLYCDCTLALLICCFSTRSFVSMAFLMMHAGAGAGGYNEERMHACSV